MSQAVPSSTRTGPASTAKPNLPGSSGASACARRAARSAAIRSVSSPSTAKGCTMILRRVSCATVSSTRSSARNPAISAAWPASVTPRICTLARAERSISPLPYTAASCAIPRACSALSRPSRGRIRTTKPSPDIIGRKAPGHHPCTTGAFSSWPKYPRGERPQASWGADSPPSPLAIPCCPVIPASPAWP